MKSYMTEELSVFSKENLGSLQSLTSEDGELWFTGKSVADIPQLLQSLFRLIVISEKEKIMARRKTSGLASP